MLQGLKTMLDEAKGMWVEELHGVLLAYWITPQVLTNEAPFNLAYGTEVVILVEIGLSTMKIEHYEEPSNSNRLKANLNLLEETWNQAHLWIVTYR